MERLGFIRDMLDVKVLILYVVNNAMNPLTLAEIYELCYQDDSLNYFDVSIAVPEMVGTGHLELVGEDHYAVTEKGKETQAITEDSIAYPVLQRTRAALERYNRKARRDSFIRSEILARESGDYSVVLGLDDELGNLMTLELMAPSQTQAQALAKSFHKKAEKLFQVVMTELLEEKERELDGEV